MTGVKADFNINILAQQTRLHNLGSPSVSVGTSFKKKFIEGVNTKNKANVLFSGTRTIAPSGTDDLRLTNVLTDNLGKTINFTEIVGIYIHAADTNTNNVVIGAATSNQFVGPFGSAAHTISLAPDESVMLTNQNGWAVTALTGDTLRIANSADSTPVKYEIIIVGRNIKLPISVADFANGQYSLHDESVSLATLWKEDLSGLGDHFDITPGKGIYNHQTGVSHYSGAVATDTLLAELKDGFTLVMEHELNMLAGVTDANHPEAYCGAILFGLPDYAPYMATTTDSFSGTSIFTQINSDDSGTLVHADDGPKTGQHHFAMMVSGGGLYASFDHGAVHQSPVLNGWNTLGVEAGAYNTLGVGEYEAIISKVTIYPAVNPIDLPNM